jgi:hypothetical protein
MVALVLSSMMISPWNGADLPTVAQDAAEYRLTLQAKPGSTVHLTATSVAAGWIAAFCTGKLCSPMQATEHIPKSGQLVIAFELVREVSDAPHRSGAVIKGSDRSSVRVPPAQR